MNLIRKLSEVVKLFRDDFFVLVVLYLFGDECPFRKPSADKNENKDLSDLQSNNIPLETVFDGFHLKRGYNRFENRLNSL